MIGILAGMGPRSTAPFIDEVVSACQRLYEAKNDIDFPPMMIYSLPTPFYVDRPIDHPAMEKIICEGLKKLESTGVEFIAMPCNVAHLYFDRLQGCIRIPLLNIVTVTLAAIPSGKHRCAILGTRPTMEAGIYQKGLKAAGIELVQQPHWQGIVDELILTIKPGGNAPPLWERFAKELAMEKVDLVLLVDTDLTVVVHGQQPFHVIDSSRCLAEATVASYLSAHRDVRHRPR